MAAAHLPKIPSVQFHSLFVHEWTIYRAASSHTLRLRVEKIKIEISIHRRHDKS